MVEVPGEVTILVTSVGVVTAKVEVPGGVATLVALLEWVATGRADPLETSNEVLILTKRIG